MTTADFSDSLYGFMKRALPAIAWIVAILALLAGFGIDFSNTEQGGAIDLRNRVTGVRLMLHGIDPYHYKWHLGEPEEYCDPYNNPHLTVSKTTATPALLALPLPLALLPYRTAEFAWLFVQWAMLLGTGALWLRRCATGRGRLCFAIFFVGFTCTAAWRLHAERGQAYVVLLFLFACWLALTLDPKRGNGFLAGFFAGILTALRPPFLVLAPFLALHRRGQLLGMGAGLVLGIGGPLLINPACWSDYFSAMQTHSELYRTADDTRPGPQSYPATIEGMSTDLLASYAVIPYADFSAHALLRLLGCAPFPAEPVLLAILVPFGIWLGLSRAQPVPRLLAALAAWLFLIDLFLPAYRDSYNDVLILNVVALGIVGAAGKIPWGWWPCALALPVGWAVYVFAPEQPWLIDLPTALFTAGALLFLFDIRAGSRKV